MKTKRRQELAKQRKELLTSFNKRSQLVANLKANMLRNRSQNNVEKYERQKKLIEGRSGLIEKTKQKQEEERLNLEEKIQIKRNN